MMVLVYLYKILKQKADFSKYDSNFISLGYATNEAVWIKLPLQILQKKL